MADLLFERRDGVAWITFNRPAQKNALSPEAICGLADALRELQADDALRLGVLTGAGDETFTSGGDLKLLLPLWTGGRQPADEYDRRVLSEPSVMQTALMKEAAFEKPLIAAINGDALAGGFELMLACDVRISVPNARFGLTEVQRALVPGGGSMVRLARQIPWARAMEILLTGDPIPAQEALQLGLVNRLVPPSDLLPVVETLASRLARNGPLALRAIKRTALETSGVPLPEAFAIEARNSAPVMRSEDALEGPRAFAQKRPPVYRGR